MPSRDLSISSLTGQSTLFDLNDKLGTLNDLTQNFNNNGILADTGLTTNIPRFSLTRLTPYVPILGASAGTFTTTTYNTFYSIDGDNSSGFEMYLTAFIFAAAVNNTPTYLSVGLPPTWYISHQMVAVAAAPYLDNGIAGNGVVSVNDTNDRTAVRVFKDLNATAWTVSAATTYIAYQVRFRVRH